MSGLTESGRRRLLMESAFAAVNYGLEAEIGRLMVVLPYLLNSAHDMKLCRAFMLFGLHRPAEAAACLDDCEGPDACMLRQVLESESPNGYRHSMPATANRHR